MKQGIIFGALAGACWGFIFLPPVLLPEISPLLLTCGRFATYGILAAILLIPQWRNIARVWHHRDLLTLIRLSLMSNVLYFLLVAVAVKQVGIAATSLVIGLIPVMVPVLGRRDQHAPPFRQLLLPMAAIIAGVVLINLHALQTSSHQVTEGKRQMLGMLCAFAALLCWSRYAVENSRCLKNLPYNSNQWSLLIGLCTGCISVLLWLIASIFRFSAVDLSLPEHTQTLFWITNMMLAVVSSWLGYLAWNLCSRRLPVSLTGQMVVFETLFALLYGFIYSQRIPDLQETAAILLLLAGFWSRYITISSAVAATQVIVRKSRVADDGLIRFAYMYRMYTAQIHLTNHSALSVQTAKSGQGPVQRTLFTFRGEFPDQCLKRLSRQENSQPAPVSSCCTCSERPHGRGLYRNYL
ncbi:putative cationic amino acid transport protein [Raoultella ornithinolytica]|nr:putative cationic amino acid transport protein [Raoultella ornithinolytica]